MEINNKVDKSVDIFISKKIELEKIAKNWKKLEKIKKEGKTKKIDIPKKKEKKKVWIKTNFYFYTRIYVFIVRQKIIHKKSKF